MSITGSRLYIKRTLVALALTQVGLLIALVTVVSQLWQTQKVPAPIINLSPTTNEANQIPHSLAAISSRVRTATGVGSAVSVSSNLAITNWHVVKASGLGATVWLDTIDGAYVFEVVEGDEARDLAMLRSTSKYRFAHWAKMHEQAMEWGQRVVAVGCENCHLPMPSVGYWVRPMPNGLGQMSISCFWGSSGGGVFDSATGDLCGVVVQWDEPADHNGIKSFPSVFYCIPFNVLNDFIARAADCDDRAPKAEVVPVPAPKPLSSPTDGGRP